MCTVYRNRLSVSQAPRTLLAAAAFGAAALTVGAPAAAAELACAAPQSVPIETVRTMPPPTIDNSLTQPQLQLLAEHRHPGRALGLYNAYVNGSFNARIQMRWEESEACL